MKGINSFLWHAGKHVNVCGIQLSSIYALCAECFFSYIYCSMLGAYCYNYSSFVDTSSYERAPSKGESPETIVLFYSLLHIFLSLCLLWKCKNFMMHGVA